MNILKLYNKANKFFNNDDFTKTVELCKKILKKDPLYKSAWNLLGSSLQRSGYHKEAEKSFLTALKIDPNLWETMYNIANLYLLLDNNEKAAEYWLKALPYMEDSAEIYNNLGVVCVKLSLIDEAILYYKEALKYQKLFSLGRQSWLHLLKQAIQAKIEGNIL